MKLFKKLNKGFTLVELVVVIAVIAILSAVSVVAYVGITKKAKVSTAQQEADQIAITLRSGALTSAHGYEEETAYETHHTSIDLLPAEPAELDGKCDLCGAEHVGEAIHNVDVKYTVSWAKEGLVIEKNALDDRTVSQILEDMYGEIEDLSLEDLGKIELHSTASFTENKVTISEFSYKRPAAYDDYVVAKLA